MKAWSTDSAKRPAETPPDSPNTQALKKRRRQQLLQQDQQSQQADNLGAKRNNPSTLPVVSQASLFGSASNPAAEPSGSTVPQSSMMQPSMRAIGATVGQQPAIDLTQFFSPAEPLPLKPRSKLSQMTPLPPSMIGSATNPPRTTTAGAARPLNAGAVPQSDRAGPSPSGSALLPACFVPPHHHLIDWDSLQSTFHKFGRQRTPPLRFEHMSEGAQRVVLGKKSQKKSIEIAQGLLNELKTDQLFNDIFRKKSDSRKQVFEKIIYRFIAFGVEINLEKIPHDYKSFRKTSKKMIESLNALVDDYKFNINYIDKEWLGIQSKSQSASVLAGDAPESASKIPGAANASFYSVAAGPAPMFDSPQLPHMPPNRAGALQAGFVGFPTAPSAAPVSVGQEMPDNPLTNGGPLSGDSHTFGEQRNPPLRFLELPEEAQLAILGSSRHPRSLQIVKDLVNRINNGQEIEELKLKSEYKEKKHTVEKALYKLIAFGVEIKNEDLLRKYGLFNPTSSFLQSAIIDINLSYKLNIEFINKEWRNIYERDKAHNNSDNIAGLGAQSDIDPTSVPTSPVPRAINLSLAVTDTGAGPSSAGAAPTVPQLPPAAQQVAAPVATGFTGAVADEAAPSQSSDVPIFASLPLPMFSPNAGAGARASLTELASAAVASWGAGAYAPPAATAAEAGPSSAGAAPQLPPELADAPQAQQPPLPTVKSDPESFLARSRLALPGLTPQVEFRDFFDATGADGDVIDKSDVRTVLMPQVDLEEMSRRPIFQAFDDCNQASQKLNQPYTVPDMHKGYLLKISHEVDEQTYNTVASNLNPLLRNDDARAQHELKYFDVAEITAANMPAHLQNDQAPHATVGMRGTIAKQDIPKFTPLQYSAQIFSEAELEQFTIKIGQRLINLNEVDGTEDGGVSQAAINRAGEMISAYSWTARKIRDDIKAKDKDGNLTSKAEIFHLNALGAGNVAAMINHADLADCNMGVVYMRCKDRYGKMTMEMTVYYALEDIPKGTQLLVNYGDVYNFDTSNLPDITEERDLPHDALPAMQQQTVVKQEPEDR